MVIAPYEERSGEGEGQMRFNEQAGANPSDGGGCSAGRTCGAMGRPR